MVDFDTVKRFVQELQLATIDEDPSEGIVVVEDEERGLKNLILNCEDPLLIFEQRILDVPTCPGELFRRLLQMNRTLVHGAFVLDEAGKSVLLHDKPRHDILYLSGELSRLYAASHHRAQQYSATS